MNAQRFHALWSRCVPMRDNAESVFNEVLQHYSEPHRYYHTPEHIDHCLAQLHLSTHLMDEPDAVEMAIWFHDVVYDPKADDNERVSAELFMERCRDGTCGDFAQKVFQLIMTTTHMRHPESLDERHMVDIDLSSFGSPYQAFLADGEAVRKEFRHVPDAKYFPARLKFLQSLMGRPSFYHTSFFQERYETCARENITRHIAELKAAGYVPD